MYFEQRMKRAMQDLVYKEINSPVGILKLVASDEALLAILMENDIKGRANLAEMAKASQQIILDQASMQVDEYFLGERTTFDLPLNLIGTDFQKKVWQALTLIPYGKTISYGELAASMGAPTASRAVGGAIGKNPISIVLPCHRVIGANHKLVGFSGGLPAKALLLRLESQIIKCH